MGKIKILYVHQISSIGGASFCLLSILKSLNRDEYEPVVLLKCNGPLVDELKKLEVQVYFLPELCAIPYNKSLFEIKTIIGYWNVLKGCKKFGQFLSYNQFDIVYLNNMMLYPYLKKIKASKSILHVREHWPLNEHVKQLTKAREVIGRYATRLIAINHYSAYMFDNCADKTDIVYDWIDFSDRYKPYPLDDIFGESMNGKKVYLFTGGTNWTKGPATVIETFTSCIKDENARLLILGVKPRKKETGIKTRIKQLLHLLGRKDPQAELQAMIAKDNRIKCLPGIYELKDIIEQSYCMLSFFAIPHANLALAESTILGTPVVAAETAESVEYSDGGRLAVLYPFGDKTAFSGAIDYLNNNYERLKSTIQKDKGVIEKLFSPERNIQVLNEVYKKAINS